MGLRTAIAGTAVAVGIGLCPVAGSAQGYSGPYLAALSADIAQDHDEAARYYLRVLGYNPNDLDILQRAMRSQVAAGDPGAAVVLARRVEALTDESELAELLLIAEDIREGRLTSALDRIERDEGTLLPLLSALWRGWLLLNTGEENAAFEAFAAMDENPTIAMFGRYHAGLAHAALGDFEEAVALLSDHPEGPVELNRGATRARLEALSAVGRGEEAAATVEDLLEGGIGDIEFETLATALAQGVDGITAVQSPLDGMALALEDVAGAFSGQGDLASLLYARIASWLDPDLGEARLIAANALSGQGQSDLALASLAAVPVASPLHAEAEMTRAAILEGLGEIDAAAEVYTTLVRTHPEALRVRFLQAELLRGAERFDEAIAAYDSAIELAEASGADLWQLYNGRAVAHHRSDNWPLAEADFRAALAIEPEQPFVLNYLGYTLVERREKLDEALDMIERAVEARPDNGFIVDSLGWVYYTLGRYDEAVVQMERAVELEPIDPILNDHLGDVYWAVGRKREAEFQWHRALSFEPEPELAERIRRKLDIGLDAVLEEEEGPAPLDEARNGN
ncbi:MAG: tetratricopeptide repeat protein [Rubricella sp.]